MEKFKYGLKILKLGPYHVIMQQRSGENAMSFAWSTRDKAVAAIQSMITRIEQQTEKSNDQEI